MLCLEIVADMKGGVVARCRGSARRCHDTMIRVLKQGLRD